MQAWFVSRLFRICAAASCKDGLTEIWDQVDTAKANGIEPWAYLNHVFEKLPEATSQEDIEALLPWRVEIKELVARVATG